MTEAVAKPRRKRQDPTEDLSRNEAAYVTLKEALVTLAYKPGEYLNTAQLVDRFGLGRTPILQALHRLSAEGLIQILPRKGAMAAPLSIDDALELIDVRLANEELCVRLAAERITDAEAAELAAIADQFEQDAKRRDLVALMTTDRKFHEKIAEIARNSMLRDILSVLHARSQRFWALSFLTEGHIAEVMAEHRAIVAALGAHDGARAAAAIRQHVLSFRASLLVRSR
ncbi:GntR family transcriptional regulator [Ramlibacter sp. 2FC]|uniref:GntR family transcriptional regulator n=1 Tax=Ramlibacter sp. 2FC TaxID=2502188 RepID=UPI0010F9BE64|nr:GntR family transcriptional regulator [Ramlibacter sp. 2FC]